MSLCLYFQAVMIFFAFADGGREQDEQLLKEFVAVPTVSSEPNRRPGIERGVELATETIRSFGGKAKVHRSKDAVISMEKVLKCPVMFLGLSLPEHGYHAPNENFDWQQASGGIVAFAKYLESISQIECAEIKRRRRSQ